jgi:hypothetical protein
LSDLSYFKASELRTYLLYLCPIVLADGVLREDCYQHFLKHACSIRILIDPSKRAFIPVAKNMLLDFVDEFEDLYGKENVVFNVHLLTHLADDCLLYGTLDEFSCFEFESFIFSIKMLIHSPKDPHIQIINRSIEKMNFMALETLKRF